MKGVHIIGWACWLLVALVAWAPPLLAQEDSPLAVEAPVETPEQPSEDASAPSPFEQGFKQGFEASNGGDFEDIQSALSIYLGPDNSSIKLLEAAQEHPVIADAWVDNRDEMQGAMINAATTAFLPLLLMLIGVQFIAYFAGAFGASKIFAPRHASLLNAVIFAAIPTFLGLIGICLLLTHSAPLIVMGNAIIVIAIVIALIIATMYLYDVGLLTMLLFALVGNLIAGVVMVVLSNILMAAMAAQLLGSGMDTLAEVYAQKAAPLVAKKADSLKPKLEEAQQQIQAEKDRLEGLKTQEVEAQETIKRLQAEVASKRQTPQLVYTAIGQLVDQEKMDNAIASYAEFAAKFPGHPLASKAKEQIELLESLKAENEAERKANRAAMIAEEKRQLAAFKQRLASNEVTLSDIRKAVLGKTQTEVIELLGQADAAQANMLIYTEIQVFDPVRNRNRNFIINFLEGRVQGANYIR